MAQLVRIGNSQGIRIPKPLIHQADLEGKELDLKVVDRGLLISPSKKPREGWEIAIEKLLTSQGLEKRDSEWLSARITSDDDLEW